MARALSAARAKGAGRGPGAALPALGSHTRAAYDLLYAYRGRRPPRDAWSALLNTGNHKRAVSDLRDYWGCDIRNLEGRHVPVLVGGWFGSCYVDYLAEAPAADARATRPVSA